MILSVTEKALVSPLKGAYSIDTTANHIFVACFMDDTIRAISKSTMSVAGSISSVTKVTDVKCMYPYIFVIHENKMSIYDVTNISLIEKKSDTTIAGAYWAFLLSTNIVGVLDATSMKLYSFSNPSNPTLISSYGNLSIPHDAEVVTQGNYKYVFVPCNNNLRIFDVTNPNNIILKYTLSMTGGHSACIVGNYAFVSSYTEDKIYVWYIPNLHNTTPALLTTFACSLPMCLESVRLSDTDFVLAITRNMDEIKAFEIGTATIFETSFQHDIDFNGLRYLLDDNGLYVADYHADTLYKLSLVAKGGVYNLGVNIADNLSVSIVGKRGGMHYLSANIRSSLQSSIETYDDKAFYTPVCNVYIVDINGVEHDITQYVLNIGTLIWQCQQDYHITEFTASNCNITLKNYSEQFDIDTDNFFVKCGYKADGKHVPIKIKNGGLDMFWGVIVSSVISTEDDTMDIEISCISALLRESDCIVGDKWENVRLSGGDAYCFLDADILADTKHIFVTVYHGNRGNFPTAFAESGYVQIENEKVFYSGIQKVGDRWCLIGCDRGVFGTATTKHEKGTYVHYILDDGSDTEGRKFQLPFYPVFEKGLKIYTSDGEVVLVESVDAFSRIEKSKRKIYACVDYEKGIVTFAEKPTDNTSVYSSFLSVINNISYHGLARRVLKSQGMDDLLIEKVEMNDYLDRKVYTQFGAITHVYDGDMIKNLGSQKCRAITTDNNGNIYLALGKYLVKYDYERFSLCVTIPDNREIIKLGANSAGSIFGVISDQDFYNPSQGIFRWDIQSGYSLLIDNICNYRDMGTEAINFGKQWKNFSIDNVRNCLYFLYYNSSLDTAGVAKIGFGGTGYAEYSVPFHNDPTNEGLRGIDFADTGDYLDVIYVYGNYYTTRYSRINKNNGSISHIGIVTSNSFTNVKLYICDMCYNPADNRIYYNEIIDTELQYYWRGFFKSVSVGTTSIANIERYFWKRISAFPYFGGKNSGLTYNDGYVWYVKGSEYAMGEDIDGSTGSIFRIVNNIPEEITGSVVVDAEPMKGVFANLEFYDDKLFAVFCDMNYVNRFKKRFNFVQYSSKFIPIIRLADVRGRSNWDVLSEIALLASYELGTTKTGKIFMKERETEYTFLTSNITSLETTIPVESTAGFATNGIIQIGKEWIKYGSKTDTEFLNCQRGYYSTVATFQPAGEPIYKIDYVLVNLSNFKNLKSLEKIPNWDEIYNYIVVNYGDDRVEFDYKKAGEDWAICSENIYGRSVLTINNRFLTDSDIHIAEAIAWRYYQLFKDRHSVLTAEIKWEAKIKLGDVVSIKQKHRVVSDYLISRIKRIELDIENFIVRIVSVVKPNILRKSIYEYKFY